MLLWRFQAQTKVLKWLHSAFQMSFRTPRKTYLHDVCFSFAKWIAIKSHGHHQTAELCKDTTGTREGHPHGQDADMSTEGAIDGSRFAYESYTCVTCSLVRTISIKLGTCTALWRGRLLGYSTDWRWWWFGKRWGLWVRASKYVAGFPWFLSRPLSSGHTMHTSWNCVYVSIVEHSI